MAYLNKEKLIEELNKTPMIAQHIDCMDLFDAINNSIAENVTEIVRCDDCHFYTDGSNEIDSWMQCKLHSMKTSPDEYCSWAVKRKEDR